MHDDSNDEATSHDDSARTDSPEATPLNERLFVSYARADSEFALRLAEALRAANIPVWIDQLDIQGGANWDRAVEQALRETHTTLVILSPASVTSENVMDEVGFAVDDGDRIVPVLYKDCDVPLRIRRRQWADFRESFDGGMQTLLRLLSQDDRASRPSGSPAGIQPGTVSPSAYTHPPDAPARKTPWVALGAGAAVLVALGVGALSLSHEGQPASAAEPPPVTAASTVTTAATNNDATLEHLHAYQRMLAEKRSAAELSAQLAIILLSNDPATKKWAQQQLDAIKANTRIEHLEREAKLAAKGSDQEKKAMAEIEKQRARVARAAARSAWMPWEHPEEEYVEEAWVEEAVDEPPTLQGAPLPTGHPPATPRTLPQPPRGLVPPDEALPDEAQFIDDPDLPADAPPDDLPDE